MTFRQRLALERPELVRDKYCGGCKGCPSHYGYEPSKDCPLYLDLDAINRRCARCWDREMPDSGGDKA